MTTLALILAAATLVLWSFLAVLSAQLSHLSPFLSVGIALTVSGLVSLFRFRQWRIPLRTFMVGVGGIFGYHFLLFTAFRHAPAVEVNLVNYLWPLLIVLLSPLFLPGYRLRLHHLIGGLIGMAGVALVATGGKVHLDLANLWGYFLAAFAALTWACYSLLTKRLPPFPTAAVGGFCFASGILSVSIYLLQSLPAGQVIWPQGVDWLYLVLLGTGPMGAAFFTWDAALKRGDPRIIGAMSYLTPLASTLVLVVIGGRTLSLVSALAMLLIITGAVTGSLDLFRPLFFPVPDKSAR